MGPPDTLIIQNPPVTILCGRLSTWLLGSSRLPAPFNLFFLVFSGLVGAARPEHYRRPPGP